MSLRLLSTRQVAHRLRTRSRGAVMVEAVIAVPLLVIVMLISVWFAVLYTAKIDSVVSARAKTMLFAASGCEAPAEAPDRNVVDPITKWTSTITTGQDATKAISAATTPEVAGCSQEAKVYNVAMVTVEKKATMPIGRSAASGGFLTDKTFKSTSYALCNPKPQTSSGLAVMGASVGSLLNQIMGPP